MGVTETQLDYLKSAKQMLKARAFEEVVSTIYDVISDSDIVEGREDLDEGWEGIWNEVRRHAPRFMPTDVVESIDAAIKTIKRIDDKLWQVRLSEEEAITILLWSRGFQATPIKYSCSSRVPARTLAKS